MKSIFVALSALLFSPSSVAEPCSEVLDFDVKTLAGEERVNLCQAYRGKVLVVVNTASKCAFTGQYEGLEALYREYRQQGLVVLGFPSNEFGQQEPGTEQEISHFCRTTYGVEFPMFAKSRVRGPDADPFWRNLTARSGTVPKWNFYKYLIDRNGDVVDVFSSITSPDSGRFRRAIDRLLQASIKSS